MRILNFLKFLAAVALVAVTAIPAQAGVPGCVGKMWNPLADLDFRLMGGIKIAGISMMKAPTNLGEPAKHKAPPLCFCKDGLQSGIGVGLTFWMPSYINDIARQAGCLGFLSGVNILPGFISESSGQSYSAHTSRVDGVTNMQIHWAYADVAAIAGKSLFEKCNAVTGAMSIAYMTEIDFVFQNDVYSAIMTPQVAILASNAMLSQMACGIESVANTLGDWRDFGVCAWKGARMPLSGNAIAKDSAQVTNMDITVKYLTRSALIGTTLRTMGEDTVCGPKYSPFYDPFQHRYQWSFPAKVSTRYNVDMVRWGLFMKDSGSSSMLNLNTSASELSTIDTNVQVGGANGTSSTGATTTAPSAGALGAAQNILAKLPKPLNYPTHESGFMQVWEARQCCLKFLTLEDIIKKVVETLATAGGGMLADAYRFYNMANTAYQIIQDPLGAALGFIGGQLSNVIGDAFGSLTDGVGNLFEGPLNGLSDSIGDFIPLGPGMARTDNPIQFAGISPEDAPQSRDYAAIWTKDASALIFPLASLK